MTDLKNKLIPIEDVLTLMLAGNFTFTATSLKTQNHYTFNIKIDDEKQEHYEWNVTVLGNRGKYVDLGKLVFYEQVEFEPIPVYLEKTALNAFIVIMDILKKQKEGLIEFRASGKCCRCGRQLTDDKSIEKMIGEECEKKHREFILSLIE